MTDNRTELKEGRSKVLRLHMPVELGLSMGELNRHFEALRIQLGANADGVVNVGWVRYGDVKTDVVASCGAMPRIIRNEVCFGERLGKPHTHLRVSQWFDRPFEVVR